jgi:hypothetical protein
VKKISSKSNQIEFPLLMSGPEDSRAKISRLRAWARDQGLEGVKVGYFIDLLNYWESGFRKLLSLKTSTAFCLATEDETSRSYSRSWTNSGMAWRGVCLTAKTSESPNHVAESSLLECIETHSVPERYFLSPNAARGILRRVDDQRRNLPPSFRRSLEILAKGL